jgi:hypothetical protein
MIRVRTICANLPGARHSEGRRGAASQARARATRESSEEASQGGPLPNPPSWHGINGSLIGPVHVISFNTSLHHAYFPPPRTTPASPQPRQRACSARADLQRPRNPPRHPPAPVLAYRTCPARAPQLLGLNVNAGQAIKLRLRADAYDGFRAYGDLRRVLCYELARNVWGAHDNNVSV